MKHLLFTLLCFALCLQSCNDVTTTEIPQEVSFTVDYNFNSGNMTKANDDAYTQFYNKYIKTRQITPDNFTLIFTNKATGQQNQIKGLWSEKRLIKLTEGTYTVTGSSEDAFSENDLEIKDKAILTFNTEVVIDQNTSSITIKALYNCSLLIFDASLKRNILYVWSSNKSQDLKKLDTYYYCFTKDLSQLKSNYFLIISTNGKSSTILTSKLKLDIGKYYFFNDVSGGFDLDPMTPGN